MTKIHTEQNCLLRPGNTNCGGCGMSTALTMLGRTLTQDKAIMVIPACCAIVTAGAYPTTGYGVPAVAATFASSPAYASGVSAVSQINHENTPTLCWAGDGGTYDIGLASLSAAAERNEDIMYFCYDNEIYGNTGGQRSSATPRGASTTTSPLGKAERKKPILEIMAAHRIPYAASLSIAHPEDFYRKIRHAWSITGFRFFLIHAPCPTGWKSDPADSIELVRLAVQSGLFLLYEVFDGQRYVINIEPDGTDPLEYYQKQRRFRSDNIDRSTVANDVANNLRRLKLLAQLPH